MRDHMDPVLGEELERVFSGLERSAAQSGLDDLDPRFSEPRRRTMLVTAIVGVVVVVAAVLAIHTGQALSHPAVAPTSNAPVVNSSALLSALPKQPYGRVVHTWTEHDATNTTGPFTVTGSTVVLAGVCSGGGTISITAPGRAANTLSCSKLSVQQPFWKFNLGGDRKPTKETAAVRVEVKVLSGSPRYIVRMWAVDPRILDADKWSVAATSATVPRSLRTCTAADLGPKGTFDRLSGRSEGVVTLTSRSTTDCAIRSWPVMRYLTGDGRYVGPAWGADSNGRSVDSSEGAVDKYGEFPPARLAAGGSAYLIVDLRTEAELKKDDEQQNAQPTPTTGPKITIPLCEPQKVSAIQLKIGPATVTVPAPETPTPAACRSDNLVFGVNPVVTERPTGE